jgi:hypothetical protein
MSFDGNGRYYTRTGPCDLDTPEDLINGSTYETYKSIKFYHSIIRFINAMLKIFICLLSAILFYSDEISDIILSVDYYKKCRDQNIASYKNCSLVICENEINYCKAYKITLLIVVFSWVLNAILIMFSHKKEIKENLNKNKHWKNFGLILMVLLQIDFIYW